MVVIPIETANLLRFFRTLQLSAHEAILRTVARLNAQSTIGPELSLAITRSIHLGTCTRNAPAAIQSFDPVHHSVQILAEGLITAPQLAQRPQPVFPVIDRAQHPRAQQVGQLARIDLVALVAFL